VGVGVGGLNDRTDWVDAGLVFCKDRWAKTPIFTGASLAPSIHEPRAQMVRVRIATIIEIPKIVC
jgi:hypothetical protein